MVEFTNQPTLFSASEAERITGVPKDQQRDWRRRGFLKEIESGKARFDVHVLAELAALKSFADRGIGPTVASQYVESVALRIAAAALDWREAIRDDLGIVEEERKAKGIPRWTWFLRLSFDARFIVVWADGSYEFVNKLDEAFDDMTTDDARLHGAAVVIDLKAVGSELLARAGQPLMSIVAAPAAD